jgi:hypothetical protein
MFFNLGKKFRQDFRNVPPLFSQANFRQNAKMVIAKMRTRKISFSTLMKVIFCRTSHTRTDGSPSLAAIRRKSAASRSTTSQNLTTDSGSMMTFHNQNLQYSSDPQLLNLRHFSLAISHFLINYLGVKRFSPIILLLGLPQKQPSLILK